MPTLYARLQGKSPNEIFPAWLIAIVLIPLILFPLTLSYVIVVQKAMGVGVALRQGLQYTLARGGIRILQMIAIGTVIVAGTTMAGNANHDRLQKTIIILVGITAYFTIRRLGDGLRTWVDRRFFRENYNAEHVLTELSDEVRSMVEPRSLLETVAGRISQTLHVPQVAVLLSGGGFYQPAFAMGYASLPTVEFPSKTGTAMVLKSQKEPARVFLNDRDSWVYREQTIGDEERRKLATLQSELLLPLAVRDKLLGFISLGPKRSEEPYTGSDVRLLKSVAAQTGLALENANLLQTVADEVAKRERLNREVEIAREVLERLFPQKLPVIAGLDYAGHCRPALGVGGDYYDFLALPQGHLGIAIGDVSGKGIAAALMMASLQASLRSEATRAPESLGSRRGQRQSPGLRGLRVESLRDLLLWSIRSGARQIRLCKRRPQSPHAFSSRCRRSSHSTRTRRHGHRSDRKRPLPAGFCADQPRRPAGGLYRRHQRSHEPGGRGMGRGSPDRRQFAVVLQKRRRSCWSVCFSRPLPNLLGPPRSMTI